MFIGRENELNILNEAYASPNSEFCVIYGRRRIGKSTLLQHFVTDKSSFFYLAGRESKHLQLKRFVRELGETVGDPLTSKVSISNWDEALTLLDRSIGPFCQRHGSSKMVIIFDEFQWMCNGCPELLSDLQRFWDTRWKDARSVYLIVCGSAISFMLGEVLSQKSPLFGRRTRSFEMGPFYVREASSFLPGKGRFEVAEVYMAVGGVPKYLEVLNTREPFRKTMGKEAFSRSGFFFDEVRFILSEQLKETDRYFMILEHIACQPMGVIEIEKATGIASGQIMHYLERLQMLGFVSRHIPCGARSGSKKVRYRLDDYYLRLYFTFIHPNRERIATGSGGESFSDIISNRWDSYAGLSFEHFVRDHARAVVQMLGYENSIRRTSSYWQRQTKRKHGVQIDLLIECDDMTTLICECKWSRKKTGIDVVEDLRKKVSLYPNVQGHTLRMVLVAAGGVTEAVKREADISVVTLNDFWSH